MAWKHWIMENGETIALGLAAPVIGVFVYFLKRGGKEAWVMHSSIADHTKRIGALERAMSEREIMCTDHKDTLDGISAAIADSKLKTLEAIGKLSERIARLEGPN